METVKDILENIESDLVEKTSQLDLDNSRHRDKICENVTAFANDLPRHNLPGYFLIGLDDKTNQRTNFKVTDEYQLKLISKVKNAGKILPPPSIDVFVDPDPTNGDVLIVRVTPSLELPVRYDNEIYIRVGPTVSRAVKTQERVLLERYRSSQLPFELRPCREAQLSDLDIPLFTSTYLPLAVSKRVIDENERSMEEKLASVRFWDIVDHCPTNLGILTLCSYPEYFIPSAYIQYVKFSGSEITSDPIEEVLIKGDIYAVAKRIEMLLEELVVRSYIKTEGFEETWRPNYPSEAIRELTMNALIHKDYEAHAPIQIYVFSNSIAITNPGDRYGRARLSFPPLNDYRNNFLATVLKNYGFVHQFGRGIRQSIESLEQNGNKYDFDLTMEASHSFSVRIFDTKSSKS